jgi:hypothetical protein
LHDAHRKVRVPSQFRRRARKATRQHGLGTVEQLARDDRLEVTTLVSDAVLRHVDDAGVELIAQQHADGLRAERLAASVA